MKRIFVLIVIITMVFSQLSFGFAVKLIEESYDLNLHKCSGKCS